MESTKIFFDILFDYQDLQYIFEYGFYWDDRVSGKLLEKSSQKARELSVILSQHIYQKNDYALWSDHIEGKTKRSDRRLLSGNRYCLAKNPWYLELFGCCGAHNSWQADSYITACRNGRFSLCREKKNLCSYRRLCAMMEQCELIAALQDQVEQRERLEDFLKDAVNECSDILIGRDRVCLKMNLWTRDAMFSCLPNPKTYQNFLEMIRFFSAFAPLGALGASFLRRLGVSAATETFFVRDLPPHYALEQEYLFRALYAMVHQREILWQGRSYLPISLCYRDKGLTGLPEHLYLRAQRQEDGTCEFLPLFSGAYLEPGILSKQMPVQFDEDIADCNTVTVEVDFFCDATKTNYLLRRRQENWADCVVSTCELDEKKNLHSPYHPDIESWSIDRVQYQIAENDLQGFLLFVKSFGDFARLVECPVIPDNQLQILKVLKKGKIREHQSLLNLYSSKMLIEKCKNPLPPRCVELEWIEFVLSSYPNLAKIFLDEESIEQIRVKLQEEINLQGWFEENHFAYSSRVKDIVPQTCKKYQKIYDAVKQNLVLTYDYHNRDVVIYPYALEYAVTRHLSRRLREPIDVMCYDLREKRNLRVLYGEIKTANSVTQENFVFSKWDKLYHVLAYAVRCAAFDVQQIDTKEDRFSQVIELCFKKDPRGKDAYTRCMRKKYGKIKYEAYCNSYWDLLRMANSDTELTAFVENVFSYWQTDEESFCDSENQAQYAYYALLLHAFYNAVKLEKTMKVFSLSARLDQINGSLIWKLICGPECNEIMNEIAYLNEYVLKRRVSFTLRTADHAAIDKVYRLFGNFVCAGELLSENHIRFTVSYESFNFRKIHMALMALVDEIQDIVPIGTAEIIAKRLANQKKECVHE